MDPHAKLIPLRLHPMGFIEAFTRLGAELGALLHATGIDEHLLADPDARISYAQQKQLVKNGIALCRVPGLGLRVAQGFDWSFHGTVGAVVYCAPSLRVAGEAYHRYIMVAQPYYAMYPQRHPLMYIHDRDHLIYPLRALPAGENDRALREFEMEFRLATTLRFWDLCGNKDVADPSVRVHLTCAEPDHAQLYRQLPCASIEFGCEHAYIAAHRDFVLKPFRPFRRHAFARLLAQCEEELRRSDLERSYSAKVRWHVYAQFRDVTLEKVAEILNVTPRTLARRLAAENTTFRDIVHQVRMELTSYHLRHSKLSVDEIAELMGFSCASSLRRAIKNWTGETASTVRSCGRERSVAAYAALCLTVVLASLPMLE